MCAHYALQMQYITAYLVYSLQKSCFILYCQSCPKWIPIILSLWQLTIEENPDIQYVSIFGFECDHFFLSGEEKANNLSNCYIFVYYRHMTCLNSPEGLLAAHCFVLHQPWQFSETVMIHSWCITVHYGKELSCLFLSKPHQIKLLFFACISYYDFSFVIC